MAIQLGVLAEHGLGEQSSTDANSMSKELLDPLKGLGVAPGSVVFDSGYWAILPSAGIPIPAKPPALNPTAKSKTPKKP